MCGTPDIEQPDIPAQPRINPDAAEIAKKRVRAALEGTGRQATIRTGPSGALSPAQTVRARALSGAST